MIQAPGQREPQRLLRRLLDDDAGGPTLEWALLLAGIGIPLVMILYLGLPAYSAADGWRRISVWALLVEYYRMQTTLTSLPVP